MRFSPNLLARFAKFIAIGALVGIVFSVVFIALPLAALIFLISAADMGWSLPWVPTAPFLIFAGAVVGAVFAAILFIKDRYIPYVEDVPDFEDDNEGPGSGPHLH